MDNGHQDTLETRTADPKKELDLNRRLALALAVLLTPAALMAASLAFWRLAADLNWTGEFAIRNGPFSHWQTWIATAALLQIMASKLNRWGRGGKAVS